jgi:hypothetical protein
VSETTSLNTRKLIRKRRKKGDAEGKTLQKNDNFKKVKERRLRAKKEI